jgi:hypothetical protein
MKHFDRTTSERIDKVLRVLAEDFNLRKKGVLKTETLEQLELSIPCSLGEKKLTLNRNLNF